MQNVDKLVIGEKLPYGNLTEIYGNTAGSMEVRGDDWLEFIAFMPNVTPQEIEAFKQKDIGVVYYGNSSNGKNVIYLETGIGVFECFFNPNIYTDDRMDGFLKCNNTMLFMMLVDSSSMTIKAIRYIPVTNKVADKIKSMWQSAIDCNISRDEYDSWLNKEIMPVNPAVHLRVAKDIGKLKGGLTPESSVFIGNL